MKKPKNTLTSGFTLLEVLMVSIILFFLTYTVFISVRQTVDMKENIDEKTASLQETRALLGLLQRDFEQSIYTRAEDLGWNPKAKKKKNKADDDSTVEYEEEITEQSPSTPPETIHLFQGKSDFLFFSTATHQRTFQNARENEDHFVTYQIVDNNLVRAESVRAVSFADREDPSQFRQFKLLSNVKTLKFEYFHPKSQQWLTSWDTQKQETKHLLPAAVKIFLEFDPEDIKVKERLGTQTLHTAFRVGESIFRNSPLSARQRAQRAKN